MLRLIPLSQNDPRWKFRKLGYGSGTIKNYGCLLVSYTMVLRYFEKKEEKPDYVDEVEYVNTNMKLSGGYSTPGGNTTPEGKGNLWVWAKADEVFGTKYEVSSGGRYVDADVKGWINTGIPVIVKVDGKPIGGLSHYVVAIGDGKIIDPWDGKIKSFSTYKPLGYHVYTYEKKDRIADAGKKINNSLDKEIITNSNNWNYLRKKYDISDVKQIDDKIEYYEDAIKSVEDAYKKYVIDWQAKSVKNKAFYNDKIKQYENKIKKIENKTIELIDKTIDLQKEAYACGQLNKKLESTIKISEEEDVKIRAVGEAIEDRLRTQLKIETEKAKNCLVELKEIDAEPNNFEKIQLLTSQLSQCEKKCELLKNKTIQASSTKDLFTEIINRFFMKN